NGPISSIRFENITDGLQDYEYLNLLSKLVALKANDKSLSASQKVTLEEAKKLLIIPDSLGSDIKNYTLDSQKILDYRLLIVEMVEKLN
ncbi:MAG: hypothetical protein WCS73_11965, partial [Lentisphaeria bacterium]